MEIVGEGCGDVRLAMLGLRVMMLTAKALTRHRMSVPQTSMYSPLSWLRMAVGISRSTLEPMVTF